MRRDLIGRVTIGLVLVSAVVLVLVVGSTIHDLFGSLTLPRGER